MFDYHSMWISQLLKKFEFPVQRTVLTGKLNSNVVTAKQIYILHRVVQQRQVIKTIQNSFEQKNHIYQSKNTFQVTIHTSYQFQRNFIQSVNFVKKMPNFSGPKTSSVLYKHMIGPLHYKFDKLQNARQNTKKTFLEAWYGMYVYVLCKF